VDRVHELTPLRDDLRIRLEQLSAARNRTERGKARPDRLGAEDAFESRNRHPELGRNRFRRRQLETNAAVADVDHARRPACDVEHQSFDRLLPELATWLAAEDLEVIVRAYMSQSGYEQAQRDEKLPVQVRAAVLQTVLGQHRAATDLLGQKAFSAQERARLSTATGVAHA